MISAAHTWFGRSQGRVAGRGRCGAAPRGGSLLSRALSSQPLVAAPCFRLTGGGQAQHRRHRVIPRPSPGQATNGVARYLLVEPSHQRQLFSIRRRRPATDPTGRQSEQHIAGRTDRSPRPRAIVAARSARFFARTSGRKNSAPGVEPGARPPGSPLAASRPAKTADA